MPEDFSSFSTKASYEVFFAQFYSKILSIKWSKNKTIQHSV